MILHVYVGDGNGAGPVNPDQPDQPSVLGSYTISPAKPTVNDVITVTASNGRSGIILHWGVNSFERPIEAYLPEGSTYHTDGKAARTPFALNADGKYEVKIGPFNNPDQEVSYISFVTNTGSDWDNNGGKDYRINIEKASSITSIETETEAQVQYYTLQGVRVANPTNGIYIEVRDGKARKVIK